MAYTTYRGALVAAATWGVVLAALIDVERFGLYEQLHVPLPVSTVRERTTSGALMSLLRWKDEAASLRYAHPPDPAVDASMVPPPGGP